MLRTRTIFLATAIWLLGLSGANAQDQGPSKCYALASLGGSYTVIGHYG